jgi:hypothetical protein
VFVRDSKVNVRQHTHRESDRFLRDKKERVNPHVPEPPGNVPPQKNEYKTFSYFLRLFYSKVNEGVLVLRKSLE